MLVHEYTWRLTGAHLKTGCKWGVAWRNAFRVCVCTYRAWDSGVIGCACGDMALRVACRISPFLKNYIDLYARASTTLPRRLMYTLLEIMYTLQGIARCSRAESRGK